ncbi:MAG: adenylyl-sulfate kinase [Deltaproteobacteria bacterium]|nr:adenylyl-sulfate kinase [Deltaproteobacteria bacterium]
MAQKKATNIVWHPAKVTRSKREGLNGHRGFTIWFTGLSAAGKSTLAVAVEEALYEHGCHAYVLDGDNVRHGLNSNLGFSPEDRVENIRRIAEVAKLFRDAGVINLTAFISPYRVDREGARKLAEAEHDAFIEVFVDCLIEVCEQRDPKGMYKKARAGIIKDFTGISAPYEPPEKPEIHLRTDQTTVEECVQAVMNYLIDRNYIPCSPNRIQTTYCTGQSSSA